VAPDAPVGDEFARPAPDAEQTPSGLAYRVLRRGTGTERAKTTSTVKISYTAWMQDRSIVDDGTARALTVAVDEVAPGLSEALQRMVVGEKTRFWLPARLADPLGPPGMSVVFDIELLSIQHAAEGRPGTIQVQSNTPTLGYALVRPDGAVLRGKGTQTFDGMVPGSYRIKPDVDRWYAVGLVAAPGDMVLRPGSALTITITYAPIVR
jgi:hypothetical protein